MGAGATGTPGVCAAAGPSAGAGDTHTAADRRAAGGVAADRGSRPPAESALAVAVGVGAGVGGVAGPQGAAGVGEQVEAGSDVAPVCQSWAGGHRRNSGLGQSSRLGEGCPQPSFRPDTSSQSLPVPLLPLKPPPPPPPPRQSSEAASVSKCVCAVGGGGGVEPLKGTAWDSRSFPPPQC